MMVRTECSEKRPTGKEWVEVAPPAEPVRCVSVNASETGMRSHRRDPTAEQTTAQISRCRKQGVPSPYARLVPVAPSPWRRSGLSRALG
jgi:hypothetical protein